MRHCVKFEADEIYYLKDNSLCTDRKISVGVCPVCNKKIAILLELKSDGTVNKIVKTGTTVNNFIKKYSKDILFSASECNAAKFKPKPFGWRYGINKCVTHNGIVKQQQIACDFYGNTEIIKIA